MEVKKAIVTGGAGFIGSHIVDKLIAMNIKVLAIDNMRSGRKSNFNHHLENKEDNYQIAFLNIKNERSMDTTIGLFKPDVIFHLAAIPGVSYSVNNPRESDATNVNGTVNLLECSVKHKVKRFIFSSSSSIYGGELPNKEDKNPAPKSPYALQKKIGEDYCKLFSKQFEIETVSLRYFNVFGPRQFGDSPYAAVIAAFANCLKNKSVPQIYGDGKQYRDFTYVENVISANILAATSDQTLKGNIYNVGSGSPVSVNKLHKMMKLPKAKYLKERLGDVKASCANIDKIKKELKYKVLVPFEEGLEKTLDWYLSV